MHKNTVKGTGKKIFQDKNGIYLPDSSQPSPLNPLKYSPHVSTRYINVEKNSKEPLMAEGGIHADDTKFCLPELYTNKENCCGCTACYAVCPMSGPERPKSAIYKNGNIEFLSPGNNGLKEIHKHTGAISMLPDEEGFFYPVIDASICTRCYKCLSVCNFKKDQQRM